MKYTFFVPHAFAMESKQSERDTKRGGRERRSEKAMSKPGRERQWTNVRVKKYERQRQNTPGIETHPSMKENKQSERDTITRRGAGERDGGEKSERDTKRGETEGRKARETRIGAMTNGD